VLKWLGSLSQRGAEPFGSNAFGAEPPVEPAWTMGFRTAQPEQCFERSQPQTFVDSKQNLTDGTQQRPAMPVLPGQCTK